jgi:hypothetical protein
MTTPTMGVRFHVSRHGRKWIPSISVWSDSYPDPLPPPLEARGSVEDDEAERATKGVGVMKAGFTGHPLTCVVGCEKLN